MGADATEPQLRAMLTNSVAICENLRAYADDTFAGIGGDLDTLHLSLAGQRTPVDLANAANRFRARLSAAISSQSATEFLVAIVREYAASLTLGGGSSNTLELFNALYAHFVETNQTLKSREFVFGPGVPDAGNVGAAVLVRVTQDRYGFDLEGGRAERKEITCVSDANTGASKWAELFEILGAPASFDWLQWDTKGSGTLSPNLMRVLHSGTGAGGSDLSNSSFGTFDTAQVPKFDAWEEVSGAGGVSSDTVDYYHAAPGESVPRALKLSFGSGDIELRQPLDLMRISSFDVSTPKYLRIMVNASLGAAGGGSVELHIGSKSISATIASLPAGWSELRIPLGPESWFVEQNIEDVAVRILWTTPGAGYLLIDDAIMAPLTFVDGTWRAMVYNTDLPLAPAKLEDLITETDTANLPADAKIQSWLVRSGLGPLPASATPSIPDPA